MWLDTFGRTEEQDKEFFSQLGAVQPPKKEEPGLFTGTGKALAYAIPHGLLGTASLLDDFSVKKLSQLYDLPNLQNEDALSEPIEIKKDSLEIAIQKAKEDAKYHRLKVKKNWTPNPETTGAAAQMIHGITSTMFKALGYSVIAGGNPYVASGLFGADMGLIERGTLIDKGVDENTANLAGLASGVANAVGMVLPASIGMSYKTSALFGGTANIVTDIGEKASIKAILDNADYKKISGEYDPFDPTNLGVSAGVGVLFGLAGAKGAKVRARKAKEAEEERLRLLKEKELAEEKEAEARAREAEKGITEEAKKTQETKAPPKINPEILNSIQNRDRSSKNSVAQMQIISQNPDFNKLAEGRTLQTGTPVISYVPNSTKLVLGKNVQVSTNEAGDRVTMQYAVIESNSVLTSHGVLGDVHKGYTNPKVQRARAIAGNGRVAGVNDAYKHRTADKYRKELTEQIADYGIDPAEVAKMKRPMLVRIMDEKDITLETGQESNRSGIQGLDPVEQAKQDAVNVDVENIVFNKDGTISQKSISEFVFKNPDKTGMVDPRGNIIADNAAQRMRTAVFSGAYRDTTLISRFLANGEKERKILDALLQVAPEIVKLRKIGGEYDYSNDAVEAAADVFQTRKETKGLEREENTISLLQSTPEQEFFKKILLSKHPEALKNVIQRMLEVAEQERLSADGGIVQPLTHSELSENVFKEFADVDLTPDIESILARSEEFKRSITSDTVDAAMELNSARVITQDQPSGPNGNINKSLQDEATAREQIDDGKKVEVTGEGVDPEVMDNNVSSFITRFVKELVGAGADKKIAGMNARIIDAFFSTMGIRLGKSRKEIEAEYELKVQKGEEPQANSYAQQKTAEQKLAEESKNWECFVDSLTSKPTNHVRMLTQTPVVMHLVGADFKELYATPHFFDRIFENKDGSKTTFTKEEIKKIPSALADPVAIFDQENGRKLFLLDFTTKSKAPILVPVEFNAQGEIATVNLAVSCFAKEKDGKPKWGWINSESLKGKELYVNKQKLSSMEPYSGANSLRVLQSRITESVLTEDDLVKERQKYPGYYQTQNEAPLVTVHNLSEENLNKAMDLGGLAVPSLGITKRDTAYADFGDISLIGTKDMVDPRKGTPVFSQDAYTQTFPKLTWEKSLNQEGANKVKELLKGVLEKFGDGKDSLDSLMYFANERFEPSKTKFINSLLQSDPVRKWFLKQKGIEVEPVMRSAGPVGKLPGVLGNPDVIAFAEAHKDLTGKWRSVNEFKKGEFSEVAAEFKELLKKQKNLNEEEKKLIEYLDKKEQKWATFKTYRTLSDILAAKKRKTEKFYEDAGATSSKIGDEVRARQDEFEAFVSQLADQAFDEPQIKVGRSYRPVTLSNVVEAMVNDRVVNQEKTMTFGSGKIRAANAKELKSLNEIQANRDKIADPAVVREQNKAVEEKIKDFRNRAVNYYKYSDSFDAMNAVGEALARAAKGKPTRAKLRNALSKNFTNVPESLIDKGMQIIRDIDKSLTDYFEAKPQRAVKFNEFAGAVVPKKTAPETIARLEKEGIKVAIYDETLPDGRQKAITELTDSLQKERDDILYQNGRKGIYTPGERVITLLQSADESTFVHESGHYFLDVLTDIGSRERVPKQIKDDIQTLMDWFGVKDLEEWNSLSFEEKRQYHEKFARGFEQYLREGKAPSSTLEKVFKSFKDWLMKIYRSAEELDVELSPEVRSVYDRLLATDEQIKQRRAEEAGIKVRPEESSTVRAETSPAEAITEQQVSEAIDTLPVPEQAKGLLKEAIGIEDTSGQQQATGEKHPHSGIPTEEEFIRQSLETDSVRDPDAFIVDENGNEVSLKDYLAEQDRIAEREIKDANAMGVAAECMWRQGAFDEI